MGQLSGLSSLLCVQAFCDNGGTLLSNGQCDCAPGFYGLKCECDGFITDDRACTA